MQTIWSLFTGRKNKLSVASKLKCIRWSKGHAHAGAEAEFELRTLCVGDGAKVKVTCRTQKGKKLDKVEGVVFRNRWRGSVVITGKMKAGDCVYLEAKLSKIKIEGVSNLIPIRAPIDEEDKS